MIHQHYKLVDVFTAAENIVLGLDEGGRLDIKAANAKVKEICDRYGFDIDPTQKIYDMSVSQKQTVEIVKVLYRGADILILDEPTAVLTPQETDKLFTVLRNMTRRRQGHRHHHPQAPRGHGPVRQGGRPPQGQVHRHRQDRRDCIRRP